MLFFFVVIFWLRLVIYFNWLWYFWCRIKVFDGRDCLVVREWYWLVGVNLWNEDLILISVLFIILCGLSKLGVINDLYIDFSCLVGWMFIILLSVGEKVLWFKILFVYWKFIILK